MVRQLPFSFGLQAVLWNQGQVSLLESISLPWFLDGMILRQIFQKRFTNIDLIDIFTREAAPVASLNLLCLFP